MRLAGFIFCLILSASIGTAHASERCILKKAAEMDAAISPQGSFAVPAIISGKRYFLEIDTGGWSSLIRESVARELALPIEPIPSMGGRVKLRDGTGEIVPNMSKVSHMVLGGMPTTNEQFVVLPDADIDALDKNAPIRLAGTLGQNFLANFDIEFDPANKKFRLFYINQCGGSNPVYWSQDYFEIPFRRKGIMPYVKIKLDGEEIEAGLDTGAAHSYIDNSKARRALDVDPTENPNPKGEEVRFINSKAIAYPHQFKMLELGGATFSNPTVRIVDLARGLDFILGMDRLRHMRFYISNQPVKQWTNSQSRRLSRDQLRKIIMEGTEGTIYATPANTTLPAMAGN